MNAVLDFYPLNKGKLRANYLRILLEYSLAVLCSVIRYLKLVRTLYESSSPVLAYWLSTTYSQQFIRHICHLTQPGRESSRIKVENISDDRLFFGRGELLAT